MMIYLQKRVIDQNGRSLLSIENAKIRCGMTAEPLLRQFLGISASNQRERKGLVKQNFRAP
nr:hypothetical protein [Aeromonas fluvialis]